MQKLLTVFQQNINSLYAIFNDQSFNDALVNNIVSFEQLGPDLCPYSHTSEDIFFSGITQIHVPLPVTWSVSEDTIDLYPVDGSVCIVLGVKVV